MNVWAFLWFEWLQMIPNQRKWHINEMNLSPPRILIMIFFFQKEQQPKRKNQIPKSRAIEKSYWPICPCSEQKCDSISTSEPALQRGPSASSPSTKSTICLSVEALCPTVWVHRTSTEVSPSRWFPMLQRFSASSPPGLQTRPSQTSTRSVWWIGWRRLVRSIWIISTNFMPAPLWSAGIRVRGLRQRLPSWLISPNGFRLGISPS